MRMLICDISPPSLLECINMEVGKTQAKIDFLPPLDRCKLTVSICNKYRYLIGNPIYFN